MRQILLLLLILSIGCVENLKSQGHWRDDIVLHYRNHDYIFQDLYILQKNNTSLDTLAIIPSTTLDKLLRSRDYVKENFLFDSTKYNISDFINFDGEFIDAVFPQGNKIWFGVSFYEGEGCEGIGRIGFYDIDKKSIGILFHPAIKDHSFKELYLTKDTIYVKTYGFYELSESYGTGIVAISTVTLDAIAKVPPGNESIYDKDDPTAVNPIYKLPLIELIRRKDFISKNVKQFSTVEKKYIIDKGLYNYMIENSK